MRALGGLLVIALEQAVAAPYCTRQLADGGARVIKLERAGGETARHYDSVVNGASAYFAWLNRGKESLVLDVKDTAEVIEETQRRRGTRRKHRKPHRGPSDTRQTALPSSGRHSCQQAVKELKGPPPSKQEPSEDEELVESMEE